MRFSVPLVDVDEFRANGRVFDEQVAHVENRKNWTRVFQYIFSNRKELLYRLSSWNCYIIIVIICVMESVWSGKFTYNQTNGFAWVLDILYIEKVLRWKSFGTSTIIPRGQTTVWSSSNCSDCLRISLLLWRRGVTPHCFVCRNRKNIREICVDCNVSSEGEIGVCMIWIIFCFRGCLCNSIVRTSETECSHLNRTHEHNWHPTRQCSLHRSAIKHNEIVFLMTIIYIYRESKRYLRINKNRVAYENVVQLCIVAAKRELNTICPFAMTLESTVMLPLCILH